MKYRVPTYQVGGRVLLNRSLFKDAYAKSQDYDKLNGRRFGPFVILKLLGKNTLKLELHDHIKIHPVVHISHTIPHKEQLADIAASFQPRPEPVQAEEGEEYEVKAILKHRDRGKGCQFLTLMKGKPTHDAHWLRKKSFVDKDGTVTKLWKEYIYRTEILHQYH